MKIKIRHGLAGLFFGGFLLICASVGIGSLAQNLGGIVIEGESLDSIIIGKSTSEDVISSYGENYKLINHNGYSYEMIYKNLGLAFYYCQADPNREIFSIEIEAPSQVTTSKGIKLGESTFDDIARIYGEDGHEGVSFYDEEDASEEDSEDARTQTPANSQAEKADSQNLDSTDSEKSENEELVIDEADTSNNRVGELNQSNSSDEDTESRDESENQAASTDQSEEVEEPKPRIVKRMELTEKGMIIRQCDERFPRKKNK